MNNYTILILCGTGFLTLIIVMALRSYYRKVIKKKDLGIVQQLHEHDRLAKELEYINVEKKVMEKLLESKFDAVVFFNTELKEVKGSNTRKIIHN